MENSIFSGAYISLNGPPAHQLDLWAGEQSTTSPVVDAANQLLRLGIVPVRDVFKSKAATSSGWQHSRPTLEALPAMFAGQCNLALLLGEPSGGLVDLDLDWPEAGPIAAALVPDSWRFGRGVPFKLRHILLRSPGAVSATFDVPAKLNGARKGRRILEVLATGKKVTCPPSVHPSGEAIEWETSPHGSPVAEVSADELRRLAGRIAGAALLCRHWGEFDGSRHELTAALAGACHYAGWPRAETEAVLTALLRQVDDTERRDRARAVVDTLDRAANGQAVTGWPRAAELLGVDLAGCLAAWWGLGQADVGLTFGGLTAEQAAVQLPPAGDVLSALTFGGQPAAAWGATWPELLEFEQADAGDGDTENAYPVDALGPILGPAVEALAYRQQVPLALAAQACLAASAAVVQERYNVLCDGREVPLSIWLVLVATPGERKSSTDLEATRLLQVRMREAEVRYQVALGAWDSAKREKDAGDPGPKPRKPSWLLTACTTEGLVKALDKQWPSLTLTNTDAAAWLGGYSMREGRDTATAAVLSGLWSGSFHAEAKASLEETTSLHGRRLSLSLMLQPAVAAALFDSATLAGQGFLSRCLPAFPASTMGTRMYRRRVEDARLSRYEAALDALLALPPTINLLTGELNPRALHLTDAAFDAWVAVHDRYERGLLAEFKSIAEVANKSAEQVLRLAGVQAALEGSPQVQLSHIERAAALMDWHLGEWQRIHVRLVEHRREVALPKQLLDWLEHRRATTGQATFTLRELYKSGPRLVRGRSQLARELLAELVRRGYVRPDSKGYELRPEGL